MKIDVALPKEIPSTYIKSFGLRPFIAAYTDLEFLALHLSGLVLLYEGKGMLSFCPEDGRNRVAVIERNKLEEQMQEQRLKKIMASPIR